MSDTLSKARTLIESRLAELEDERKRLERALSGLGDKRRAATAKRRRSAGARAKRGQRQEQFLAAVKANPNVPTAELAREIGVSPNQAHGLAARLRKGKKIRKSGKGHKIT